MKINYQLQLDNIINNIQKEQITPTLLLHSCCAPCSSYVLEYLSDYFRISVLYFNPNIYPASEYYYRENEQREFIEKLETKNKIDFIRAEYDPKLYFEAIKGYEMDREGGHRCHLCYELRFREAAKVAAENNFDYFTTTLSISPHKDSQILNQLGEKIAEEYGVNYLFSDFKKKNGFKRSVELTNKYNMYRQDYCGCVFSYNESKNR